jgi:hypothetical protein
MKQLHEYPTPETDKLWDYHVGEDWIDSYSIYRDMQNLERRLAACRERLLDIHNTTSSSRIRRESRQTLNLTKKP